MCLALPAEVMELYADGTARVMLGGLAKRVSLALVEGVTAGDYVIVHTGYALSVLDREEAEATLALLRSAGSEEGPA